MTMREVTVESDHDQPYFDEQWYLRRYPDVRDAIRKTSIKDAWDHYQQLGRAENRETFGFDEALYLALYPDVLQALNQDDHPSARDHFLAHGRQEGRGARQECGRVFAYGAFGTNNVGDEAILEGIMRVYPECVQIYHNRPRGGPAIRPADILENQWFFAASDYLIIGGGGLLYDRETVVLMTQLATAARAAGATVDIRALGCEAAMTDYLPEIAALFACARFITLRSTRSRQIMHQMIGHYYPVEFDFAFNLTPEVRAVAKHRRPGRTPTIGVVTASIDDGSLRAIAEVIRRHTRRAVERPVRFVYIPHSRSYFDTDNNDCITAHKLWSMCYAYNLKDDSLLQLQDFDPDPLSVLRSYRGLDGVMSSRYHGLIFGKISQVPTLALASNLIKIRSFVDDHRTDDLFLADDLAKLQDSFLPFIDRVRERLEPPGANEQL